MGQCSTTNLDSKFSFLYLYRALKNFTQLIAVIRCFTTNYSTKLIEVILVLIPTISLILYNTHVLYYISLYTSCVLNGKKRSNNKKILIDEEGNLDAADVDKPRPRPRPKKKKKKKRTKQRELNVCKRSDTKRRRGGSRPRLTNLLTGFNQRQGRRLDEVKLAAALPSLMHLGTGF